MSTLGKTKWKEKVTYEGGVIRVTGYKPKTIYGPPKPKAGKSAKEARQEHRATKRASRKRKREHRRSRKNK